MQQTRKHRVTRIRTLSGGCFALEVDGPIPETRSGQFYMVRTDLQWPVLLPRPFSLYGRGPDGESGSFLMKGIGPGTNAFRDCAVGEEVWVTGPLGRPFPEDVEKPVCVAGGIGLAPFLLLAQRQLELGRDPVRLLFGGRNVALLAGMQDFEQIADVHPCTDDGSHGFHGMVTGADGPDEGPELGKLIVFSGVGEYPARVKCATLAWHTVNAAIENRGELVTTE